MRIGAAPSHAALSRPGSLPPFEDAQLELFGDPGLFEHAEELLAEHHKAGRDAGEFRELGNLSVYSKGGPLGDSGSRRHGRALRFLHREPPRRREFTNLAWLRRQGFEAAEPLLSAYARRGSRLIAQLLVTARVERAGGLRPLLEDGRRDPLREPVLERLATTTGTLHARGFLHGDLYPRNLLHSGGVNAGEAGRGVRIVLLDAWRGGVHKKPNVLAHAGRDLGCFFLHGAEWLDALEQQRFYKRYLAAVRDGGHRVDPAKLRRAIESGRAREQRRFASDPRRRRDLPETETGWQLPK